MPIAKTQFEPHLIADFKVGKFLRRDPWLTPRDGFETLKNCHLYQGVLEKRRGYSQFGRFVHRDTADIGTGDGNTTSFSGTLSHTNLRATDFDVQDVTLQDDSTESFTDNGDGTVTGDQGASGTYTVATGAWTLDFSGSLAPKDTITISVIYDHYPGNAVMGIWNYLTSGGSESLMAFDKKRMNIWNTNNGEFDDKSYPDSIDFTGDKTNFFWLQNWEMPASTFKAYICNNKDNLHAWDGSNLAAVNVDTDNDSSNELNRCLLIFVYHNRLILLRTEEDGTSYYQRARYSALNDPTDWREDIGGHGGHTDAPTEDWIMGADFLGSELIIWFERSIWKLNYTGDETNPFEWEKIDATEGCYATMSILAFSDELQGVGPTRIVATDGREAYGIDEKIPDFMLEWRQDGIPYCYSLVLEELKQSWIAYPDLGATVDADGNYYPDRVLVLNYEENCYSVYHLDVHSLGYSSLQSDTTMDDLSGSWDSYGWYWDSRELQAGYPTTLMGCRDGWVYKLNDGGSDNGSDIEFEAKSGLWNPYSKAGLKAHLGWIDFLVDVGTELSFDVECFINTKDTAWQTKAVNCTAVAGAEHKVWKRVYLNAVAAGHRINITNNASGNRPRIHAICPYFRPAGPLI